MWCVFEAKLSRMKNFAHFCLKQPLNHFSVKHVSIPFLRNNPLSPIYGAKRTMWRILRQNCRGRKLRSLLPKKAPKSYFWKTHFRSVFTKSPPSPIFEAYQTMWRAARQNCHKRPLHLFPGPNGLCGAIRGEIFMNENFTRFCLNGLEIIFPKNTFPVRFYETAPLTYFRGQTDYVARCEAKLSRTKTSLAFA
jgi:hypothetical protein